VSEFLSTADPTAIDYSDKFEGLVGRKIPVMGIYRPFRLHVHCSDGSSGPYFVSVSQAETFALVGGWAHLGDYVTGPEARLTISLASPLSEELSHVMWVKTVGVYLDTSETERIDPQSNSAAFYTVVPGRYILFILTGNRVICMKQVMLQGPHARLKLSISEQSCKVDEASFLSVSD
jgi:hypothetical protein